MTTRIQCLLWDFGDTLCNERFIWDSGPAWMEVYRTFDDGLGNEWCRGDIDVRAFAARLSERMSLSADEILAHMRARCEHIEFFPFTHAFFRARHLPQAIVTVNPDLFSDVIVPSCGFADVTDAIVTSWEERTTDKGRLCEIAMERIGIACSPSEVMLIDNKGECLDAWARRGGAGYLFRGDDVFERDVAAGIDGLASA